MTHPWSAFTNPKPPTGEPPKRVSGEPIVVQNYYAMSPEELEVSIASMREWFLHFSDSDKYPKVQHALEVALAAQELNTRGKDEFIQLLIDTLC